MNGTLRKSWQNAKKEQGRQANIVSCACFVVLWETYGWRKKRIISRFNDATQAINEAARKYKSVFEILEEETGIEIALDGDKSYHEYMFLSSDTKARNLTDAEIIYMQKRSMKWVQPTVLSALCIVLHRQDGWGFDRLSKLLYHVDLIRQLLGNNEQKYMDYMYQITGESAKELWG